MGILSVIRAKRSQAAFSQLTRASPPPSPTLLLGPPEIRVVVPTNLQNPAAAAHSSHSQWEEQRTIHPPSSPPATPALISSSMSSQTLCLPTSTNSFPSLTTLKLICNPQVSDETMRILSVIRETQTQAAVSKLTRGLPPAIATLLLGPPELRPNPAQPQCTQPKPAQPQCTQPKPSDPFVDLMVANFNDTFT
ncbi:PREDICTED: LOC110754062 [Prunus dulcis]|uniref:PREDICTED: LOC110754062 n=1 Tax=Prunus dulcis TaxID=3755 RepID=A0A5E4F1Y6_PRUDU|nr:PREDICTED: LOC110754062 [Prunus dulcis]